MHHEIAGKEHVGVQELDHVDLKIKARNGENRNLFRYERKKERNIPVRKNERKKYPGQKERKKEMHQSEINKYNGQTERKIYTRRKERKKYTSQKERKKEIHRSESWKERKTLWILKCSRARYNEMSVFSASESSSSSNKYEIPPRFW